MKRIKKIIKQHYPYIITIFAIVFPWFFKSGYLFFTDFSWGHNFRLNWTGGCWIFNVFFKIFSFLPQDLSQKLFMALCLFAVLLGAEKIVENCISDKWLVFVVSLFALFNPFIYDRIMYGQFSVVLAFAFLCFSAGYLLEYLNKREEKQILLAGVFTGLMIQASMHFVFFGGAFYLLFILIRLKKKNELKTIIKHLFFMGLIVLGVNFNLVIGAFFKRSAAVNFVQENISRQDLSAFQTSGKTGWEALKNITMMSGFWGKDQFRYVDLTKVKEGWGRSLTLLFPIILGGVYIGLKSKVEEKERGKLRITNYELRNLKDKQYSMSFCDKFNVPCYVFRVMCFGLLILYIIAVILAVGIRLPISRQITYWLFDYFPLYKGMREAQKWVAVIVAVYLIFLAIGVERFFRFKFVKNNRAVMSVLLAGVIIMQAPLMVWGLGGQVKPIKYPKDWYGMDEMIRRDAAEPRLDAKNQKCEDQILFLPWHMYMSFDWVGNVVANPAYKFFSCPVIQGSNMEWGGIYDNSGNQQSKIIEDWISSKGRTDLFSNIDIKYVILAKEVDWKKYSFLEEIESLILVKDTEMLRLYKNNAKCKSQNAKCN